MTLDILNSTNIMSVAITLIGIGLLYYLVDKIFKNDYANNLLKEKTLSVLRSEDGANVIKEHSKIATSETFERAFNAIDKIEKKQEHTDCNVSQLIATITELKTDVKHILQTLERILDKSN